METRAGVIPQRVSGARLLSLCRVPPQGGQSTIWLDGPGVRVGRSDVDPFVHGQAGDRPRGPAAHAAHVGSANFRDATLTWSDLRGLVQVPLDTYTYEELTKGLI